MKKNNFTLILCLACCLWSACQSSREGGQQAKTPGFTISPTDSVVVLQNSEVSLAMHLFGGAFTSFVHQRQPVNPLTWSLAAGQMPENNRQGAPFRGHFLCLGRWGSPSAGEIAAGVPHNGEPANSWWKLQKRDGQAVTVSATAPLDGLEITRKVTLSPVSPVFQVSERVTNTFSLGRPWNMVQHPTIGPPFLTRQTVVQTSAGAGFMQKWSFPDPGIAAYQWPNGFLDSLKTLPVDLRQMSTENYVTTHIFDEDTTTGWVTAFDPESRLLYGFVWKTTDYPWLNVWNYNQNGQPFAKGLEFGTTGIGRPYRDLLMNDTRFNDRASFEYLDAGETAEKSYACFIMPLPQSFGELHSITASSQTIYLHGKHTLQLRLAAPL